MHTLFLLAFLLALRHLLTQFSLEIWLLSLYVFTGFSFFPHVEETRDPADSHYTSISKSASGPSRSSVSRPSGLTYVCVYVIVVNIYVWIGSIYWINYIKFYLSQSVNQYASGVRVLARPSPAHHVPENIGSGHMWLGVHGGNNSKIR